MGLRLVLKFYAFFSFELFVINYYITRLLGPFAPIFYISTFNCGFISEHLFFVQYKTKTKTVCGFHNIFFTISKFFTGGPTKKLGTIGSAVLTFIGYKQTDKQTDKPNLYIDKIYLRKITLFVHI